MTFDDDNDENLASDEDQDQDEEMDVEEDNNDADQEMDGGDDDEDDGDDDNGDDDEEEEEDQNEADLPSRRNNQSEAQKRSSSQDATTQPSQTLGSPSLHQSSARSPGNKPRASFRPPVRDIALTAQTYDIVPTMAAPQGTSINAITATPDMRYVFTGGTDGYVRMYNWVDTANGKVPLTVAQKHPFVDSVMKAGCLVTYWENEDTSIKAPAGPDEGKWTSPVYSLAVHRQALWLVSGLESGGINLQTCRHQAGTIITTMKEHTNAVSVLNLSLDETNLLSGSWDKMIHDWDLNTGKVKRSFRGSGGQISAIEVRPASDISVPEVLEIQAESTTFSSNNADKLMSNDIFGDGVMGSGDNADEDAVGSPDGSLFGEGDHGSLFGEDMGGVAGGGAGGFDDDEDLTKALESEMQENEEKVPGTSGDALMAETTNTDPADPLDSLPTESAPLVVDEPADVPNGPAQVPNDDEGNTDPVLEKSNDAQENGISEPQEPLTAPPTNEDRGASSTSDLPLQSESTFLDASQDGTLRIWDRRMPAPIATITPYGGTPPWCTGACWSPDGNFFYAGRRNGTVEEFSIHNLGSKRSEPNRVFKFPQGSGPVYAVRAMPNKKHLLCASNDILRIYDLKQAETRHKTVPFNIVPGHRGGVISALHVDPSCRFMLSASGNRGWEGAGTEVLLGYEIGVQDEKGIWHK